MWQGVSSKRDPLLNKGQATPIFNVFEVNFSPLINAHRIYTSF